MKAAVLALALSLTPVAAEAWAPRPRLSLHKSAPMRAEAAVAVSGGSDARAGPAGVYDAAVTLGAGKAATPISKLIPLSFLSGAHIALGAMLAVSVGGSVPGIKAANPGVQRALLGVMGLPMGLLMVLGAGGELVTGNMAVCTAAYKAGKASLSDLCRNLGTVYLGNFVGSLAVAALGAWASTGVTGGGGALHRGSSSTSAKVSCGAFNTSGTGSRQSFRRRHRATGNTLKLARPSGSSWTFRASQTQLNCGLLGWTRGALVQKTKRPPWSSAAMRMSHL